MIDSILVVGDVHGCFHTFRTLVEQYWQPETMLLIQLGDLTDRGNFIPETVQYARLLEQQYPSRTVFLRGNHEEMVLEVWDMVRQASVPLAALYSRTNTTLAQYFQRSKGHSFVEDDMEWLRQRPLFWQNDAIFVSHAGVSDVWSTIEESLDTTHSESIVWTRSRLKNIGKLQIIGHTPLRTGKPDIRSSENCINIDTGAVFGISLTAIHLDLDGTVRNVFSSATHSVDYAHSSRYEY
ncbi:MAG: metallophosphoesterase family protein [Bacteroidota bacterium]|nr:serine/threonine protein phosphatase [Candidatus Kapabacteria bacterium]MDW8220548.1 metallophosphoesterase family protein [Bacteroidota bacterium]